MCSAQLWIDIVVVQDINEAIRWNNEVDQGLSSSIFTADVEKIFSWIGYLLQCYNLVWYLTVTDLKVLIVALSMLTYQLMELK